MFWKRFCERLVAEWMIIYQFGFIFYCVCNHRLIDFSRLISQSFDSLHATPSA